MVSAIIPGTGPTSLRCLSDQKNCRQQDSQERAYHNELCLTANRRVAPPCCKTLHISLFFDGTGNNLNHDLNIADPKHPTNIARLFRATVGQGYAAGLAGDMSLTDLPETAGNKYYKYYMPGVGTPFPEIMDLDFTMGGLAFASHGEDRINWGCCVSLMRCSVPPASEKWTTGNAGRRFRLCPAR